MGLRWCERCGSFFTPTNRPLTNLLAIGARGVFTDPETSVCNRCLSASESREADGRIVDVAPALAPAPNASNTYTRDTADTAGVDRLNTLINPSHA